MCDPVIGGGWDVIKCNEVKNFLGMVFDTLLCAVRSLKRLVGNLEELMDPNICPCSGVVPVLSGRGMLS